MGVGGTQKPPQKNSMYKEKRGFKRAKKKSENHRKVCGNQGINQSSTGPELIGGTC